LSAWDVGLHGVRLLDEGALLVQYRGDVERTHASRIVELVKTHLRDGWMLVDVREVGYIGQEARRELTGLHNDVVSRARLIDVGFIGADLRTRVLMITLVAAATALHRVRVRVHFFDTHDEATRAVSATR